MADLKKYEKLVKELEGIVSKLESGNLELDEATALFERGVKLAAQCSGMLDEAQSRIDVLFDEGGQLKIAPLDSVTFEEENE